MNNNKVKQKWTSPKAKRYSYSDIKVGLAPGAEANLGETS